MFAIFSFTPTKTGGFLCFVYVFQKPLTFQTPEDKSPVAQAFWENPRQREKVASQAPRRRRENR
jgi:hypothetical protein